MRVTVEVEVDDEVDSDGERRCILVDCPQTFYATDRELRRAGADLQAPPVTVSLTLAEVEMLARQWVGEFGIRGRIGDACREALQ